MTKNKRLYTAKKKVKTNKTILILGCGIKKQKDHFGIDINPKSKADLIYDLNVTPWPLENDIFNNVHCPAVLEHLNNFYGVMEEIWRVSKNNSLVYISVPHYTDTAAFTDPTHVKYFNTYSFDVLTKDTKWDFYTDAKFEVKSFTLRLLKFYKYLLFEAILNLSIRKNPLRFIRKFWENYLSFIIRGKTMEIVLRVVK